MRSILPILLLIAVAIVIGYVMNSGTYNNSSVYLLSLLATAGCGYLIADNFFKISKKKWHIHHENYKQEIIQLHNEADILKTQIKSMPPHSEIEALHNNLATALSENDNLKKNLNGQTLVISQKNNEIAELRDANDKLHVDHVITQNNLAGVEADKIQLIGAVAAKDAVIAKHENTLTQLQPIISALHDEHDKLQDTLAAKDAVIAKHENTLTQLQPIISALHDEHDKLQDTLAAKDAVIAKQGDTLTQLQPIITALHDEHDILQNNLAAKDAVIEKHEATINQLKPIIADMNDKHEQLQDSLAVKDAVIAKHEAALTQLQPVIANLQTEHDKLQNTLVAQDTAYQQLTRDLAGKNATLDEYRNAIKELHGIIAEKEKNQDQFAKDLAARNTDIAQLKTNLLAVQAERDAAKEALALKDATIVQQQNTVFALNDVIDKMKHLHEDSETQHHKDLVQVRQVLEDTRNKMAGLTDNTENNFAVKPVKPVDHEPEEPSFESTRYLSVDKSIGAVKSHRTRSVDDEQVAVPATQTPVPTIVKTEKLSEPGIPVVVPKPIELTAVVQQTPAPVKEITPTLNEAVTILPSDDLKIIEGIGPKIELVLNVAGISTWHQLSQADPEKLREILSDAGKRFNANDPSTWPEQARLLANGETEKFKAYTDFLISGRVPKA